MNDSGVYVVREPADKGSGLNLVTEKRRVGEFIAGNVRGALVEEMGLQRHDLEHFWYFPGRISLVGGAPFPHNGSKVHADVVVLYYSGDRKVFLSRNEVTGIGFMDPVNLLHDPDLRPATFPALNLITATLADQDVTTMWDILPRVRVFPAGFDPDGFYAARQALPDLFITT
ncbi:hypothetical protein HY339_02400 [Candidatus Gottesmanbacteria bacterium]|nr:hypothetical protein [Candidatus Gottesmanbacteria bacterium]